MCIFHHACCSVFSPLWWIWAVPLLRHCLRVAQWVWLIDGRQWLSPLESKHFCVVSPLKVLLSLLREKTLFVYSHSDGAGWQLLLKRRERLPLAHATLSLSFPCLSPSRLSLSISLSLSLDLFISSCISHPHLYHCGVVKGGWWFKMQIYSACTKKVSEISFTHVDTIGWKKWNEEWDFFPFDSSRCDSIPKSWK